MFSTGGGWFERGDGFLWHTKKKNRFAEAMGYFTSCVFVFVCVFCFWFTFCNQVQSIMSGIGSSISITALFF